MSKRVEASPCDQVLELIEPWIDGELNANRAEWVESHVLSCPTCAAEAGLAEEIRTELQSMPTFDLPRELVEAVADATEQIGMGRFRRFFGSLVLRPIPALTAAAVVVAVFVMNPWNLTTEEEFSATEVARATAETKLALAYVGSISRRAQTEIRERVIEGEPVSSTVRRLSKSMKWTGGSGSVAPKLDGLPQENDEGSS